MRGSRTVRRALDVARARRRDDGVHRSSLRAFAESARRERKRDQRPPVVRGELRDSYGYTWTLQGTFATRAHEKRINATAERLLHSRGGAVERAGRLARRIGASACSRTPGAPCLRAHPHDTLCGCSIDDVARAMELRLRSAVQPGERNSRRCDRRLIGHDPVGGARRARRWTPVVVVRNPAARVRSGRRDRRPRGIRRRRTGRSGVGAATTAVVVSARSPRSGARRAAVLVAAPRILANGSPRHYPDNDLVSVTRLRRGSPTSAVRHCQLSDW